MTGARTVLLFLQSKDSDALFMCRVLPFTVYFSFSGDEERTGKTRLPLPSDGTTVQCRCRRSELRLVGF